MQFITLEFFLFFIGVLLFAIFLKKNRKIYTVYLFLASLLFYYGFGEQNFVVLVISVVANYILLYKIDQEKGPKARKTAFILALIINILFLVYFKYTNFLSNSVMELASGLGIRGLNLSLEVIAPIGISFYTFRTISHLIDLYRGNVERPDFTSYATYVTFFPQILSGPISRPKDFYESLNNPKRLSYLDSEIIVLVLSGLIKKLVIASFLWEFTQGPFSTPQSFSSIDLIFAALAYSCMIYTDFSGYSDISIAVSKLMGIDVYSNFKSPYRSIGLKEFWSRWHISLSTWLKDYVYIPLGGNRGGRFNKYRNIFLTMVVSGIWHGAGINFIIWGTLHGIGSVVTHLISDRFGSNAESKKGFSILKLFGWVLTFAFVTFTWIFFNSRTPESAFYFIKGIFRSAVTENVIVSTRLFIVIFVVIYFNFIGQKFTLYIKNFISELSPIAKYIFVLLVVYAIIKLGPDMVPPFIYFSF